MSPPVLDIADLERRLLAGERAALARAITLVESRRADHQAAARELLQRLMPHTGRAQRVGITGVPGAGKSTTIESLGCTLTAAGHRVAVLAVDPSSGRHGGSILGDKTRMERLSVDPAAFIRPSPSGGALGGVARKTREAMLLCEAAGFDVVIVETVGVGQSETVVADMVDIFVALLIPGGGDELQGIKKGLIELADLLVINKADADPTKAERSARDYRNALHILTPAHRDWTPPVLTASGLTGAGLDVLWGQVQRHREVMTANGARAARRADQDARWMWAMVNDRLAEAFRAAPAVAALVDETEGAVRAGDLPASSAADRLLKAFGL
ncbi:methylmalonyl Co-A mutase-associated GTPase MeaB [Caulobacter endophyticus]|uniref:methylmalonyl Co-A mutase-associated GTPase MeaB n=1 Tax=Caulobacter endophyticus TaxID=2172652 RepID=UPI00240EB084|nr:methylmalonyl Co-A mutase-associated GTPase MeaB [Caulobacter endophyticus]MDG2529216.1 methylmalonyl Co-A mutase-associated GTPase MeaB [Caulobacter endophyticus]